MVPKIILTMELLFKEMLVEQLSPHYKLHAQVSGWHCMCVYV